MNEIIELGDIAKEFDSMLDPLVELLFSKQAVAKSITHVALKTPSTLRDYFLYKKFEHFLVSIRNKNSQDLVKFRDKLFGNKKTARDNALKLIQYIDQAETLKVIDYMINASRAVGNLLIAEDEYYRILRALSNTLCSDLEYFKTIASTDQVIQGNIRVIALAQYGLMISAGIDANLSIEDQNYAVTNFGIMVDRYALSFDDEERQKYWNNKAKGNEKNFNAVTNAIFG